MSDANRAWSRGWCFFAAACACLIAAPAEAAEKPSRPNIVLILADDLSHGDLSCTGGSDVQTPHIDRIFRGFEIS